MTASLYRANAQVDSSLITYDFTDTFWWFTVRAAERAADALANPPLAYQSTAKYLEFSYATEDEGVDEAHGSHVETFVSVSDEKTIRQQVTIPLDGQDYTFDVVICHEGDNFATKIMHGSCTKTWTAPASSEWHDCGAPAAGFHNVQFMTTTNFDGGNQWVL